jgi:DNA-binding transcriptional ArsR family regulator
MRLDNYVKSHVAWNRGQNVKYVKGKTADIVPVADLAETPVLLDLSPGAGNTAKENCILETLRPQRDDEANKSKIEDPTRRLTRRLVAARTTLQVQSVLRDAFKSLGEVIQAAASGDEEAQKILRRLQRLIRRATRKVRDLNTETDLRRKEDKSRRREMEHLAREYEQELRRRLAERRRREEGYLRDTDSNNNNSILPINAVLSTSFSAAQIKAMARQAAQMAVMTQFGFTGHAFGGNVGGNVDIVVSGGSMAVGGELSSGDGGDSQV